MSEFPESPLLEEHNVPSWLRLVLKGWDGKTPMRVSDTVGDWEIRPSIRDPNMITIARMR